MKNKCAKCGKSVNGKPNAKLKWGIIRVFEMVGASKVGWCGRCEAMTMKDISGKLFYVGSGDYP